MARQNPVSEIDRQIGQRLRKFRIETLGMSAAEFSRRIGIDSNRLATYEHGRTPLRYEVADGAAKSFNICQRWLAEGLEPSRYYVAVSQSLRDKIPQRLLFSNVYNVFLKLHIEKHLAELSALWSGKLDDEGLKVVQELGQNHIGNVGVLDLLGLLHKNLVRTVDDIPTDLYQTFYSDMLRACRDFQKSHSKRISEWQAMPRINALPTWVSQNPKTSLTTKVDSLTKDGVKPVLPNLIQRLKRATEVRGSKSELAEWLGVHRQSVTDWLSGKQEPGGEITLRLLHWVEQQERQK